MALANVSKATKVALGRLHQGFTVSSLYAIVNCKFSEYELCLKNNLSGLCQACHADWHENSKGSTDSKNVESKGKLNKLLLSMGCKVASFTREVRDIFSNPQSHLG